MKGKYQFKYVETQDVLTEYMKVNGVLKIPKTYRMVVATGGLFVLTIMLLYTDVFKRSFSEAFIFSVKFLVIWALVFVAAQFVGKTIGKKMEFLAATGDAETIYEKRMQKWKKPAEVKIDFYEDCWISHVHGNSQTLHYRNVARIIESEEVIAMIVNAEEGGQRFFAILKSGILDADVEEFKQYLLEKCAGVKKGIEQVSVAEKSKTKNKEK